MLLAPEYALEGPTARALLQPLRKVEDCNLSSRGNGKGGRVGRSLLPLNKHKNKTEGRVMSQHLREHEDVQKVGLHHGFAWIRTGDFVISRLQATLSVHGNKSNHKTEILQIVRTFHSGIISSSLMASVAS
jgi:hypothetical protein